MNLIGDFAADTEFSKLLTYQSDIDVTTAALELARDARPLLRFDPTLIALDRIAEDLRPEVTRMRSDLHALERVCEVLTARYGFGGDPACFELAESSYLDNVVTTGRGLPITLSLVYVAVCERLGLPLVGVAAPAHFLCRFEGAAGPVFVDAFRHGRILDAEECVDWISGISGLPPEAVESALEPAPPRTIVSRMLSNLKALHLRQSNWEAAERVLLRLLALRPSSFADRRDLAAVSLMLQRPGRVVDLLGGSLPSATDDERASASEVLSTARRLLAAWN
jgi:regulator of sirC expression with transglutaminase-like and TPR domain